MIRATGNYGLYPPLYMSGGYWLSFLAVNNQ